MGQWQNNFCRRYIAKEGLPTTCGENEPLLPNSVSYAMHAASELSTSASPVGNNPEDPVLDDFSMIVVVALTHLSVNAEQSSLSSAEPANILLT